MWFVSSSVGFLPDLKGRGIRLAISMNRADCKTSEYDCCLALVDSCILQVLNDRRKLIIRFDTVREFVDDDDSVSVGEVR